MMNIQKLRLTYRHRRSTGRRAALLAGLATLIGVPLFGALPATAADITLDCTPACVDSESLLISSPWEDKVHYTIGIAEDLPFWVYQAENEPIFAITRDKLDDDGRFYIEDYPGNFNWGGLYLEPVDIDQVDAGLTEWRLRGALDGWTFMGKGPTNFAVHSTDDLSDFNALTKQTLWVESPQPTASPTLQSVAFGRDMTSVEFTFDQEFLEEDLTWGLATYPALPETQSISVIPEGTFTGVNPSSIDIDGATIIARFEDVFAAGSYTVNFEIDQYNSNSGPYAVTLRKPQGLFGTAIEAASTTPPALDTDTPPVVVAAGTTLTLTFDYPITSATPATSTLTVTAGGSAVAVSSIANSGATSVLTLASAIGQDATVKVSYDAPSSGGYQDAAGNLVADFTDIAVTNNSTATATTTTTAPATTVPATTVPATENTTPSLVTEENQEALTAAAGSAKLIVNGEEVEMTLSSTGADDAGATAPEDRTEAQITELQDAADGIVERLDTAAGGDSGLTVVDTDTGAEIDGIFDDTRVPVEDVIVAESSQFSGVYASRDEDGNPNKIRAEVLEMERGGEVAVFVYGLPAGESAELVLMSTPYLLGTATADSSGNFSKVLSPPEAILAGTHTLVTASETLSVSLGIKITEPAADVTLPATGGGDFSTTPVLLVVLVGAFFVVLARRRENAEN